MANKGHLAILMQGVEVWNRWRKENRAVSPDLSDANLNGADLSKANLSNTNLSDTNLSDTNLSDANLSGANLSGANLSGANLSHASLSRANLSGADLIDARLSPAYLSESNLSRARLSRATLSRATLSYTDLSKANLNRADLNRANLNHANLGGAKLSKANLSYTDFSKANLSRANLSDANLNEAYLSDADLSYANLSRANLSGANLSKTNLSKANLSGALLIIAQALDAKFSAATLTGACIEDWNINSRTNLQNVICEYIFTSSDYDFKTGKHQFTDRRPHDPTQIFASGEFTKRYQIVLETVDLFFNNGIDWKALLDSLQDLQTQYGHDLSVQGIERKADGAFLVRLEVPSDVDKGAIERQARKLYETKLQILEAKYHSELQAKDKEIESYRRESANMMEITKLLASKPIIVEAKAEAVADNQSKNTTYNQQGSKWGGGFAAEGGIQIGGQFIDASSNQNLTEAAQEIQQLLDQLSTTYPTSTSTGRAMVAAKAVEEIEKNPALKQRVIGALKAGGVEALKELVDHPAVNILLALIDGWQNPG